MFLLCAILQVSTEVRKVTFKSNQRHARNLLLKISLPLNPPSFFQFHFVSDFSWPVFIILFSTKKLIVIKHHMHILYYKRRVLFVDGSRHSQL